MKIESIHLKRNYHESQEIHKEMTIEILNDSEKVADRVAQMIFNKIEEANNNQDKSKIVLMLPTGNTPKRMYELFTQKALGGHLDFSKIVVARVEGFIGVDDDYEKSFDKYIVDKFFKPNGIEPNDENFLRIENILSKEEIQKMSHEELQHESQRRLFDYDKKIQELGGVDIAVLGLGGDAHVGDIQSSDFKTKEKISAIKNTRPMDIKKDFDPYTQNVFATQYADKDGNLPAQYFATVGMNTLRSAKELIVMATGESKSGAVKKGIDDLKLRWQTYSNQEELKKLKEIRQNTEMSPFGFLISSAPKGSEIKVIVDKEAALLLEISN